MRASLLLLLGLFTRPVDMLSQTTTSCLQRAASGGIGSASDSIRPQPGAYNLVQVYREYPEALPYVSVLQLTRPPQAAAAPPAGQPSPRGYDLVGWLDQPGSSPAWQRIVGSKDPSHPGVVVRGSRMRAGQNSGFDGVGEVYTITHATTDSFWGTWIADDGIAVYFDSTTMRPVPPSAGFFCARRSS